jgi:hypothetical protein
MLRFLAAELWAEGPPEPAPVSDLIQPQRIQYLVRSGDPLAEDGPNVIRNLSRSPKKISAFYVYDKKGTELFERQCGTPEYYLR